MFNNIENLPVELWLDVFSYLKIRDQFNSFFNLNKRFNKILLSYQTQISLKNNDEDMKYLFKHILPYITRRENITCLRLENTNKINLIDYINLLNFPHLTTFIIHRLNITRDFLDTFQQNMTHLQYLNISSVVSGDKKFTHKLLEMIISLKNLKICSLRLGISMSPLPLKISSKSSIEKLRLTGSSENCIINRLISLIEYLPYLQSLHIIANRINFISTNISCTVPISSLILNINEFNIPFVQFMNFIWTLTPYVQELKIICRTQLQNLDYLDHREWSVFIKSLPNLKKLSLNIHPAREITEQLWNTKCHMLTKLMTKNHIVLQIYK